MAGHLLIITTTLQVCSETLLSPFFDGSSWWRATDSYIENYVPLSRHLFLLFNVANYFLKSEMCISLLPNYFLPTALAWVWPISCSCYYHHLHLLIPHNHSHHQHCFCCHYHNFDCNFNCNCKCNCYCYSGWHNLYLRTHDIVRTNRIYEDEEVSQAVRLSTVRLSLSSVGAGLSSVGVRTRRSARLSFVGVSLSSEGLRKNRMCENWEVNLAVLVRYRAVLNSCEDKLNFWGPGGHPGCPQLVWARLQKPKLRK